MSTALAQAPAAAAATATQPIAAPQWLSPEIVQAIVAAVPEPPAPGSAADQADLQTEIEVQNSRTPERSAQARKDAVLDMSLFLKDVVPTLTPESHPKFHALFRQIHHQEDTVNVAIKQRFQRPRPFVAHGDVIHPLGTITGFSYPSGHATVAFCHAVILSEIFPDKADVLIARARRIAQSRVVMGVHYTTDIQEGERSGREIARELLTTPEFLKRLAEVKAETRSD